MFFKLVSLLLLHLSSFAVSQTPSGFIYNNFRNVNLTQDGLSIITSNGLLTLTNDTRQGQGHAFYPQPFHVKNPSSNTTTFSFSTTFVFVISPKNSDLGGHGIVFVVSKSSSLPGAFPSQYLGLFNETTNGNSLNQVIGVELDTIHSSEFDDINDNHVGIDINSLTSNKSEPAGYFTNGLFKNLSLISGQAMQVWVEYDGLKQQLDVTLAPLHEPRPNKSLLSMSIDLSPFISDTMYVGFSSSTGSILTSHYIMGWSFMMNGEAQALDLSKLPKTPQRKVDKEVSRILTIGLPVSILIGVLVTSYGLFYTIRRKRKFEEVLDDWELNYVPHRFSFKDLYIATKGFKDKELLGIGGFGKVYKGVMPKSKLEVAVKRVSHDSRQGMKEFIAEIVSIGQLRHRNLVQLLGYCRRKGELLLVYDFMPNRSLDKHLFGVTPRSPTLNWLHRFQVIKGVASGLLYLHEEWEQVVIHRDIKASNVLLDGELNGRLSDFGLARLYDHGTTNPQTCTHVMGTIGYLAPEMTRTGKATKSTDVFAFGALLLEVACGRRPIEPQASNQDLVLVDWVFACWNRGGILEASDPNLGTEYKPEEMDLVLKLGLLCSHTIPSLRPNMRQVVQILHGTLPLPELTSIGLHGVSQAFDHGEDFDDFVLSFPSSMSDEVSRSPSVAESLLSGCR